MKRKYSLQWTRRKSERYLNLLSFWACFRQQYGFMPNQNPVRLLSKLWAQNSMNIQMFFSTGTHGITG